MADGYWSRQRQQQQQKQQHQHQQEKLHPSAGLLKRARPDYDLRHSGSPLSYDLGGVKDTKTIGSAYDHYLQNAKLSSGEASSGGSEMHSYPLPDIVELGLAANGRGIPMARRDIVELGLAANGRGAPMARPDIVEVGRGGSMGPANGRGIPIPRPGRAPLPLPLPADASSTLYIEGLPLNCTRREVAHIFRPFVGYKEVRLVSKESKHRGGEPVILSFVDFTTPACAATALSALQGYKMDEQDPESAYLRLQFSKYPGPRSAAGRR